MPNEDNPKRVQDLQITAVWLFAALFGGIFLVAIRFSLLFIINGLNHKGWHSTGDVFTSLLWSLAWFAIGFLLGFLFGIPKAVQRDAGNAGVTKTAPGTSSASDGPTAAAPYQLRVNTNLEEISDWLTKILVGATLTQLVKIPGLAAGAASYIARGLSEPQNSAQAFAAAIVLFFPTIGFFAGYVLTRMFFSGAFVRSDRAGLSVIDVERLQVTKLALDEPQPVDEKVQEIAERSRAVQITGALSATEAGALAKGAFLVGDTSRALQASSLAVSKNPDDYRAQLNYAVVLHKANAKSAVVLEVLKKTHDLIPPNLDLQTKEDVYNSLVYLAIYQDPPEGFSRAIEYGEEFTSSNPAKKSSIWVNLACAYGQQYSYLKSKNEANTVLQSVRDKATRAIKTAIGIDPSSKKRFAELISNDTNLDDDLKDLADDDSEVRSMIKSS
jgi:hypothetical protein